MKKRWADVVLNGTGGSEQLRVWESLKEIIGKQHDRSKVCSDPKICWGGKIEEIVTSYNDSAGEIVRWASPINIHFTTLFPVGNNRTSKNTIPSVTQSTSVDISGLNLQFIFWFD